MMSNTCPCGSGCDPARTRGSQWSRRLANAHKRASTSYAQVRIDDFGWAELQTDWMRCEIDPAFCVYCHRCSRCLDHLVPLRRGGPHSVDNLVPSCVRCNNRKGSLMLHQWLGLTTRVAYPIPHQVVALTARSLRIRTELELEGRVVQYGNPPNQVVGLLPGQRLGQDAITSGEAAG